MEMITIDVDGEAEKYCATFPDLGEVLGIVIWMDEPGALVRTEAGIYLHVTVGAICRLPQQIVAEALQKAKNKQMS